MDDKLLEQKMKEIAEQVYAEKGVKSKYTVTQVPFHTHNGTDSARINQKDIIKNITNFGNFVATEGTSIVQINNVPNSSRITLSAIAFATSKQAVVNGYAAFGRCYDFNFGTTITPTDTSTPGTPFIQMCSFSYITITGSGATLAVGSNVGTVPYIGYVNDGSEKVKMEVIDFNNGVVFLQATVATGWTFGGNIIINS
jgi:hypothetical protein